MKLKTFAEALIFQSLEDLYDPRYVHRSVEFFYGKEFTMVASMAGMSPQDRSKVLKMVNNAIKVLKEHMPKVKPKQAGRAKNLPSCPACPPQSHMAI